MSHENKTKTSKTNLAREIMTPSCYKLFWKLSTNKIVIYITSVKTKNLAAHKMWLPI